MGAVSRTAFLALPSSLGRDTASSMPPIHHEDACQPLGKARSPLFRKGA